MIVGCYAPAEGGDSNGGNNALTNNPDHSVGAGQVKSTNSNDQMQSWQLLVVRRALAWCVIIWLTLVNASLVQAMRPGPDIEDFKPPFTRSDPHIVQALVAYDKENDRGAERIARQLLAERQRRNRDELGQIEARFILARALDGQGRFTEAETEYRLGLTLIAPLLQTGRRSQSAAAQAKARTWGRYFELLLQDNLLHQSRVREAKLLPSLLPSADSGQASRTEIGVSGIGAVATSPCGFGQPDIRAPTDHEAIDRQAWDDQVVTNVAAGKAVAAEQLMRQMIALDAITFGPKHCETALDRYQLLAILVAQDRLAEAEDVAHNALSSLGDANSVQAAATLGMLATIVSKRQGPIEAEPYLRRSLAMWESVSGAESRRVLDARLDLGANLFAQRRLADAEVIYRRALADMRQSWGSNGRQTLDVQEFAGYLAEQQGRFADAAGDYRAVCATRAEQTAQSGRGTMASLVKTPDTDRAGSCSLHQAILLRHWALAGGGPAPQDQPSALRDEAFAAAQRALPSPSGEAMARAAARHAAALAAPDDLAERYETLIQKRDAAGFAPTSLPQGSFADVPLTAERQEEKDKLGDEIARIATRLSSAAPLYWDMRMPRALDVATLQHLLHKDEALIYFMVAPGDVHGLAFAVARNRAGWATLGETGAELKREVTGLRGDIDSGAYGVAEEIRAQGPGYAPFDRRKAYGLYSALFGDPEIQAVMAGHHTLIIVPTGPLIALPPGLLVTHPPRDDGASDADTMRQTDWLLREKAIAVLPSMAALRIVRDLVAPQSHGPSDPLLAFTNPDFTGGATGMGAVPVAKRGSPRNYTSYFRGGEPSVDLLRTLPSLPHTWDEGMALAKALNAPSSAVLSGIEASKAELMKRNSDGRLARARVVEFATHGLVAGDGDGLAEPALVLSAGPLPRDWLLTASDAAQLRISADWVLLSACNTASPDLQDAEGLSGLARGFFYAGASALLVSQWSLADDTAATLVPAAIRLHADKRLSRAEALRRASLAILDDRGADHTHPYFRAPFVLIGEPR